MTESLVNTQLIILVYLLFGFILYKTHIIDDHSQLFISSLTIDVLLPVSVFVSFLNSFTLDILKEMLVILIFAAFFEIFLYFISKINIKMYSKEESCVNRYGMLVSNGGLIGTPVIESLFGSIGVMYCNVFLIPTRIMAYVAGESIFNPNIKKGLKETIKATVTNKVILAMVLGFIFVSLNISLPAPVFTALSKIAGCMSPVSVMLVGSMLANIPKISGDLIKKISLMTVIRLLIIPGIAFIICMILGFDFITTSVITLLMGMPVGCTCASFAKKYKGNEAYATSVVFVTTILSTISLVGIMQIIEMIF